MLFLHGYLANKNCFSYQYKFFERDFEVFGLDFKGFGQNTPMEYPYSLADYENDLNEYMYKNGLIRPHVIAHSFGGRVAIKLSSNNPNAFNKLVLTGCAGLKPKYSFSRSARRFLFKALKKVLPKERLKRFYSPDYLALDSVMKKSFSLIVNEHLDDRLKDVVNQTLIVHGKCDRETPPYMARRLNKGIKNSRLIFFDGAGHFCFIDKPIKFNVEVREFLLS